MVARDWASICPLELGSTCTCCQESRGVRHHTQLPLRAVGVPGRPKHRNRHLAKKPRIPPGSGSYLVELLAQVVDTPLAALRPKVGRKVPPGRQNLPSPRGQGRAARPGYVGQCRIIVLATPPSQGAVSVCSRSHLQPRLRLPRSKRQPRGAALAPPKESPGFGPQPRAHGPRA